MTSDRRPEQIRLDWLYQRYHPIHLNLPVGVIAATTHAYMLYHIGCSLFHNPTGYRVHLSVFHFWRILPYVAILYGVH